MKLGIFINTDRHLAHVLGITKAAISKGHEVVIFNMDDGTKLLGNPHLGSLCKTKGVTMSFCDHSAKGLNVSTEGIPEEIVCGSQYNNAIMVNESDRVIVL
jgi:predicted peroxiredoxin